jgi:streptogramin lyase
VACGQGRGLVLSPEPWPGGLAPDGVCADAEGAIWVADPAGNRAIRVREGGRIVQVVEAGTGV